MRIVLASASPRRRDLLARLGILFTTTPSALDEAVRPGEDAAAYVCRLARDKARAIAAGDPAEVVIGADTSVILDGVILGKPADAAEARGMLGALRDRVHQVMTGVAVEGPGGASRTAVYTTNVRMRAYAAEEVERYIATGDPFDKAGSYAIQHAGFAPVATLDGCYLNVVGLPLYETLALLGGEGYPVHFGWLSAT